MRRLIFLLLISLLPACLFALDITDPLGDIYDDIQVWYDARLIKQVPPLRPYPAQVLKAVLEEVRAHPAAPQEERLLAEAYLEKLAGTSIDGVALGRTQLYSGESEEYLIGAAGIEYNTWFNEYIALNGRWVGIAKYEGDGYYAAGEAGPFDIFDDNADLDFGGRQIDLRMMFTNSFSIGSDSLYFQAGIHRSSYGPIFDNGAVLGGYAHHAPTFNVVWDSGGMFGVTNTYMELSASNYYGDEVFSDKRLAMQTYSFRPADWMEFEFLQSVVYGNRFDLVYFVPFSFLFYNQNMVGYEDNSLMGFSAAFKLPRNTAFNSVVFIDDAHLNDFMRGNFDTMLKAAFHNEFTWTPLQKNLRRLSLDYLAVTPYTYSHKDDRVDVEEFITGGQTYIDWLRENANYQNYTTYGDSLGPVLYPNSDRLSLKAHLRPLERLDLKLMGRMIRHGNPNEGMDDQFEDSVTDGSVFDDGYDKEGNHTFKDPRFLTQDTLEYSFTAGLDLAYTLDLDPYVLKLLLGYRLEHIRNRMNTEGYPVKGDNETSHYLMSGFVCSYSF